MDPAGRPDRDGVATRPDTVGVGWPVAPGFDDPPTTVRWWLVAVVATASIWAPISLLVAALGAMAVFGWSPTDDESGSGALLDGSGLGAIVPAVLVLVSFVTVAVALAAMLRAGTGWSRRRVLTVAGVLAVWAPATVAVVLGAG